MSENNLTLGPDALAEAQTQATGLGVTLTQYLAAWAGVPCTIVDMDGEEVAVITPDDIPAPEPTPDTNEDDT